MEERRIRITAGDLVVSAAIGVIITSAFALAEVARGRVTLTVDEETAITGFFEHSYIKVHDVTRAVAEKARGIVRQHGLKPPVEGSGSTWGDEIYFRTSIEGPAKDQRRRLPRGCR